MAKAVKALQAKEVNRIILTRPAVEAGERLGFLPGTLYEKIDPYLRPLYDALHDMVDPESIPKLTAAGTIEIAPLAFMRGRTLNDSFIILDEAQNTTPEQMKMFLTRLGFGSKIVVTGDVTQVDLPDGQVSGLRVVQDILDGIPDIHFARLTSRTSCGTSWSGRSSTPTSVSTPRPASPPNPQGRHRRHTRTKTGNTKVSVDINNESGVAVGEDALRELAQYVIGQMEAHPLADLSMLLVDEAHMTNLHEKWMEEPGPTDVLSFPMDELRPHSIAGPNRTRGRDEDEGEPVLLGDVVLCPQVAAAQAKQHGHSTQAELELLTVHGVLHLLGYDHADPEEEAEMFGLQNELLRDWRDQLPAGRRPPAKGRKDRPNVARRVAHARRGRPDHRGGLVRGRADGPGHGPTPTALDRYGSLLTLIRVCAEVSGAVCVTLAFAHWLGGGWQVFLPAAGVLLVAGTC